MGVAAETIQTQSAVFGSVPLAPSDWLLAAVAAALVFPATAIEKRRRRRRSRP